MMSSDYFKQGITAGLCLGAIVGIVLLIASIYNSTIVGFWHILVAVVVLLPVCTLFGGFIAALATPVIHFFENNIEIENAIESIQKGANWVKKGAFLGLILGAIYKIAIPPEVWQIDSSTFSLNYIFELLKSRLGEIVYYVSEVLVYSLVGLIIGIAISLGILLIIAALFVFRVAVQSVFWVRILFLGIVFINLTIVMNDLVGWLTFILTPLLLWLHISFHDNFCISMENAFTEAFVMCSTGFILILLGEWFHSITGI